MIIRAASCEPDAKGLAGALKECSRLRDLKGGRRLHSQALYSGQLSNKYVASSLINLYSKCGALSDARAVFDNMSHRDAVCLNSLLHGYIDNAQSRLALQLFNSLLNLPNRSWTSPFNARTYAAAITACAALAADSTTTAELEELMESGESIYSRALRHRACDMFTQTALITLYARCGGMTEARRLFDGMPQKDVVSWNALLQGYVENGDHELALELLERMEPTCTPDARTYVAGLTACGVMAGRDGGRSFNWREEIEEIHAKAVTGRCCDQFVENTLIDTYAKSGSMARARAVFDGMANRDVISWTSLLHGYVANGEFELALELFDGMETARNGCRPAARTYVAALKACASLTDNRRRSVEKGREIHARALTSSCCDIFVENSLLDLYVKHGSLEEARAAFERMVQRDTVTYNTMLQGYVESGECDEALRLFYSMKNVSNSRTYALALAACTSSLAAQSCSEDRDKRLKDGERIHSQASKNNLCDIYVDTALLNLYSRSGAVASARKVFESMPEKTVVSWNCLMQGYVENGENETALDVFSSMEAAGIQPNSATFLHGINACGNIMSLQSGKLFHAEAQRRGFDQDTVVSTCLVDFYGRCGCMERSESVFETIATKDLVAWNAFLSGFSSQGDVEQLFGVFQEMKELGVPPNEVTLLCLLSCCSHAGLTSRGEECFRGLTEVYGLTPGVKHYACMVDLYGRGNKLEQALEVVKTMTIEPNAVVWHTLLGACTKWNNLVIGKLAYDSLKALHPGDAVAYVLISNAYGNVEALTRTRSAAASRSQTWWTHENGRVYRFSS